jgi:parallel beta-helix repeat protein
MRISYVVILILINAIPCLVAGTINVPGDYPTIQQAIAAAVNGDTVLVGAGRYLENIDFIGKAITVKSLDGPVKTVIDGNLSGSVVTFSNFEGMDSVLEGFTVTNGSASYGAGIFCSNVSPIIRMNIITENYAEQGGAGIYCADGAGPRIAGNTISSNHVWFGGEGGGILCSCSSPTMVENNLLQNHAEEGGGVSCRYSSPVIRNCSFISNDSSDPGGGLFVFHGKPRLENCVFHKNEAEALYTEGGGMSNCFGHTSLYRCTFTENTIGGYVGYGAGVSNKGGVIVMTECCIAENKTYLEGGGLSNVEGTAILKDCIIEKNNVDPNWSGDGGGLYCHTGTMILTGCVITGNVAGERGGGIIGIDSDLTMSGCVISANTAHRGAAMSITGADLTISGCTIADNFTHNGGNGGGMRCQDPKACKIWNTILWNNQAPEGPELWVDNFGSAPVEIDFSDVKGGKASMYTVYGSQVIWGASMIESDPIFADGPSGDYHLTYQSPCTGTGDNYAPGLSATDFEGDPRIHQGTTDRGADEFHPHLYLMGELTPGGTVHSKLVGMPGTIPVLLFIGAETLSPPLPTQWGEFFIAPNWHVLSLTPIPTSGILYGLISSIPVIPPAPYDVPMQALIGLNADSLTNLCVLEVR